MSERPSETDLINAAVAGDSAAIEELLWSHYSALENYIAPKVPKRADRHFDVEDILQIVFTEVYRNIARFEPRGDGSFFAYLRTIADHRLIDAIRKVDRPGAKQISARFGKDDESFVDLLDAVCGSSTSPSRHACREEEIRAVRIALASLPHDQQEVVALRWLEHKSIPEIAQLTGRTEPAVRGLVYRGEKTLALLWAGRPAG